MAVLVERQGQVVVITINRPERRNALDGPTMRSIGAAFTDAEADPAVGAVVLTGAGDRAFCAGMDLKAFAEGATIDDDGAALGVITDRVYSKPIVAAVNGFAVGGGFELVLACDVVVSADHATFGLPEVKRGLIAAGGGTRLARRIPPAVALEIGLTGDGVSAYRARELGLVNDVVPLDALRGAAVVLAGRMAENAPLAVAATKRLMYREFAAHDADILEAIRREADAVFASVDAREGAAAFAERRRPMWIGA